MSEVVLVFVVVLLAMLWWRSRTSNAPPSPGLALPILGHLYLFRANHVQQFKQWREKLGDVFTVQIGPSRTVILNGYAAISEAFVTNIDKVLDRTDSFLHATTYQKSGVLSLEGDKWKEQRAFISSTLRSLGFGRNIMAQKITQEAEHLVACVGRTEGEPTDISGLVTLAVTNVIAQAAFAKRFDAEDPDVKTWIGNVRRLFRLLGSSAIVNVFPVLKYVPGDPWKLEAVESTVNGMKLMLKKWMDIEEREIHVADEAFNDLTQAYLTKIEQHRQNGKTTKTINEQNQLSSVMQLFNAGMETTATTIVIGVIYLVNYPDIQEKIYQEIKGNVVTDRLLDVSDRPKLKNLVAFIMETQRISSTGPLSVDRKVTADFSIGGFNISRGTTLLANFDSVLLDEQAWGDPGNFRPERFFSDDGGSLVTKKEFLPFGFGKRNCIGESLASMELYLFLGSLIQRFEFKPEVEGQPPSMVLNSDGISRTAQQFNVRAIPRV